MSVGLVRGWGWWVVGVWIKLFCYSYFGLLNVCSGLVGGVVRFGG